MSNLLLNRWQSIDWSQSASQWLGLLLLAIWLWLAWPKEELLQLKRDKALQSRLFLSTLAINGLWLLNASITAGIHVHFLGIVTFMLMFGWRLATLAILLPVLFFACLSCKPRLLWVGMGCWVMHYRFLSLILSTAKFTRHCRIMFLSIFLVRSLMRAYRS